MPRPERNKTDGERDACNADVRSRYRFWLRFRFGGTGAMSYRFWFERAEDREDFARGYGVVTLETGEMAADDPSSRKDSVDPRALTVEFNEHINSRDLHGLAALMTDDHALIDAADRVIRGKSKCLDAWRAFFASFPDYRNVFDSLILEANTVVVVGRSSCSDERLHGPALWVAKASADKLAEWRVCEDTPKNRHTLGIPIASTEG